ncbi:citrate synthase 4, mitochondrial-like isoform X2 [Asparagus officinalis]|uniref:citrate synthase 4, mitochondrial-like isoform X2 n=1 Tax=Asparagus officinalis TaxID=4686 RepID=UPI00098E6D10|nr:citrate synthase 4, mitochondrial-like isoform X2 [Asparagus officinalis]
MRGCWCMITCQWGACLLFSMEWLKKLKSEHGKVQLGNSIVDMVIGGMRGTTGLLWETSLLDPDEIVLPAASDGEEPLPEGLLWLLLTGKVINDLLLL